MPIVTVSGLCNQLKRKQQKTNYKWHEAGGIKYTDISVRLFLSFQCNNISRETGYAPVNKKFIYFEGF